MQHEPLPDLHKFVPQTQIDYAKPHAEQVCSKPPLEGSDRLDEPSVNRAAASSTALDVPDADIDSQSSNAEVPTTASLFDFWGVGTSIATGVTLGICGYYAHELIDPEVDATLLPETATADESRPHRAQRSSSSDALVNVAIATPEFLPSLRKEVHQWDSDLQRFSRAVQTPRPTPKLALANQDGTPQYSANPAVERWLDRAFGVRSEPTGTHWIYLAEKQAVAGQFAAAIAELEKIPDTSPHFAAAQTKILKYSQSRDVRARASLQTAYDLAAARDFNGALAFLNEIPAEASVSSTVRQKRLEYTQKREVQAKTWLYRAKNLATATRYEEAISVLRKIPQGTSVYAEAKQKLLEYHQAVTRTEPEQSKPEQREPEQRDQARLEQERLERARLEQEKIEQARLEQEQLDRARLTQERLERARLEQEKIEQARLERARLEQEKIEETSQTKQP